MTLPVPTRLHEIEYLRDGGSLAVAFHDGDGAVFNLRLPVRTTAGTFTACGYAAPELERRVPHLYTDKFTGGQHGYETRETVTLDWDDAATLVAKLAPLPVENPGAHDARLLAEMAQLIAARGAIPGQP